MTTLAPQTKVLIVEDEKDIAELVAHSLELAGYEVVKAATGMEAIERFAKDAPDLVVLDLMMPVISGLEVLQHIRQKGTTPVILLTALESEDNRVRGLQLGADDYIVKPFSVRELAARVGALLRRANVTEAGSLIEHGPLRIDRSSREVTVEGHLVEMTAKEFDLLAFLAGAPGRVFTRHQLLLEVWSSSSEWQQEGTVTEHVRRVRQKVEADPDRPMWIQTVRGVGYRFDRRHQIRTDDLHPALVAS
ncbi:MAG: response regulator transcription factor [Actinomycetota bacterium]|nr:response regulator transcription factor [Actinomycetota bacterium]